MKYQNNPILITSDYDGTISPLNLKANITAINNFIDNGNIFVISTARSKNSIMKKIKKHNIPVSYITCYNGSEIVEPSGNIIKAFEMNHQVLTFMHSLLKSNHNVSDITYINRNGCIFSRGIIPNSAIIIRCTCPIYYDLRKEIKDIPGYTCRRFGTTYEIKPSHVDKSFAAGELIDYLKDKEDTNVLEYSIGNTLNDYELLKNHNGYVINYGSPILKKRIKMRTASVSALINEIK